MRIELMSVCLAPSQGPGPDKKVTMVKIVTSLESQNDLDLNQISKLISTKNNKEGSVDICDKLQNLKINEDKKEPVENDENDPTKEVKLDKKEKEEANQRLKPEKTDVPDSQSDKDETDSDDLLSRGPIRTDTRVSNIQPYVISDRFTTIEKSRRTHLSGGDVTTTTETGGGFLTPPMTPSSTHHQVHQRNETFYVDEYGKQLSPPGSVLSDSFPYSPEAQVVPSPYADPLLRAGFLNSPAPSPAGSNSAESNCSTLVSELSSSLEELPFPSVEDSFPEDLQNFVISNTTEPAFRNSRELTLLEFIKDVKVKEDAKLGQLVPQVSVEDSASSTYSTSPGTSTSEYFSSYQPETHFVAQQPEFVAPQTNFVVTPSPPPQQTTESQGDLSLRKLLAQPNQPQVVFTQNYPMASVTPPTMTSPPIAVPRLQPFTTISTSPVTISTPTSPPVTVILVNSIPAPTYRTAGKTYKPLRPKPAPGTQPEGNPQNAPWIPLPVREIGAIPVVNSAKQRFVNLLNPEKKRQRFHMVFAANDSLIFSRDKDGDTKLHIAICNRDNELIYALVEKFKTGDINMSNKKGETALYNAAVTNQHCLVDYLIETGANISARNNEGNTALHHVCARGYHQVAQSLIKNSKLDDINTANNRGETALHYAVGYHGMKLGEHVFNNLLVTKQLIEAGASPGIQELSCGNTAFHSAATKLHTELLEVLCSSPAARNAINLVNREGKTALEIVQRLHETNPIVRSQEIMDLLVRNGATQTAVTPTIDSSFIPDFAFLLTS